MKKINTIKNIIIFIVIFCGLCYGLESILDGNLYRTLIRLSVILVVFLPSIMRKVWKVQISEASEIIYIIFIFIAHFLGSIINLYNKIYWYDNFTHFLSGIVISFFALELLVRFKKYHSKHIIFNALFIISIGFMIAGLWEYFEFISDKLFGKDAQNALTTGVDDTMMDMILATLGSILFILSYLFEEINHKKLIIKNFIKQTL